MAFLALVLVVPVKASTIKPIDFDTLRKANKDVDSDWRTSPLVSEVLANAEVRAVLEREAEAGLLATGPNARKQLVIRQKGKVREWMTVGTAVSKLLKVRNTTRESVELQKPIGRVIAVTLASIASQALTVSKVEQREDGCRIQALIFNNWYGPNANIKVDITQAGNATLVAAEVAVRGHFHDFGNSKPILAQLLVDLNTPNAFKL